ncbi:MAG: nicotinamidase [Spirochaetaceae bacterium]|jgi:nicotinamidase/pyrazinamidase|nr:nicotinamidase [Spirochaetaceae bacterium]
MDITYAKTALLEVDIQNDFCPAYTGRDGREHPAGALSVKGGNDIVAPLNSFARKLHKRGGRVLATQDWHPSNHVSFASSHKNQKIGATILIPVPDETAQLFTRQFPQLTADPIPGAIQQLLWPVHCLQNTGGAAFHDELDITLIDFVFRKGFRKNIDSYSAFFENDRCTSTDLYAYLKEQNIDALFIGGLATDYCVFYTVIDALRLGFKTFVVSDVCAGIDIPPGFLARTVDAMKKKGAEFINSTDIA